MVIPEKFDGFQGILDSDTVLGGSHHLLFRFVGVLHCLGISCAKNEKITLSEHDALVASNLFNNGDGNLVWIEW